MYKKIFVVCLIVLSIVSCKDSIKRTDEVKLGNTSKNISQSSANKPSNVNNEGINYKDQKKKSVLLDNIKFSTQIGCYYKVIIYGEKGFQNILSEEIEGNGEIFNTKLKVEIPENLLGTEFYLYFAPYTKNMKLDSTYDDKLKKFLKFNKPLTKCLAVPVTHKFKISEDTKVISVPAS